MLSAFAFPLPFDKLPAHYLREVPGRAGPRAKPRGERAEDDKLAVCHYR